MNDPTNRVEPEIVPARPGEPRWSCVRCGALLAHDLHGLRCARCSTEYPTIGRVHILVTQPESYLAAARKQVTGSRARLERDRRQQLRASLRGDRAVRAFRAFEGRTINQAVVERHCAPLLTHVRSGQPGPADRFWAHRVAWPFEQIIPYFVVDWRDSRSGRDVATAAAEAAGECRSRGEAVVVGCGAGRLVADIAGLFGCVTGIDLAIATLCVAQHLIDGGEVVLSAERAAWKHITLNGPRPSPRNVSIAAADCTRLPFDDGSVSFVATQYLLDIVDDADRVAREVNRILEPGGVWFNFGLPFRLPGDPPQPRRWTERDMTEFLGSRAFEPVTIAARDINHLDLSEQHADAFGETHRIVAFTARAIGPKPPDPLRAWRGFRSVDERRFWQLIPRFREGRSVSIAAQIVFEASGRRSAEAIRLADGAKTTSIPLTASSRRFIEVLCGLLDGAHHLDAIVAHVRSMCGPMEQDDILATIDVLEHIGIIEMG